MTINTSFLATLMLALITAITSAQSSQTTSKPSGTSATPIVGSSASPQARPDASAAGKMRFQLGAREIILPAPDGFEETASRIQSIQTAFGVTEDPNLELLAVHVPAEVFRKLQAGEAAPLSFYTKVSAPKRGKLTDFSEADMAAVGASFEATSAEIFDINKPTMQKILRDLKTRVADLTDDSLKLDISQPVNLGLLEKSPNIYSVMLLATITEQEGEEQKQTPVLCATSFVRLNHRLIYVYAYRKMTSDADVKALQDFSKTWTKKIVAANRN